jgi:hypothetical protein
MAAQVALVVVVGALAMLILERTLAADMRAVVERRLESQARGAARWVHQNRHPEHLASRLAAVVGTRVTIVDAQDVVLGDSAPGAEVGVRVAVAEAPSADGALRVRLTG